MLSKLFIASTAGLLAYQAQAATYIAADIPFENAERVSDRIVSECRNLGSTFSQSLLKEAQAAGIDLASSDNLSEAADRVEIKISDVRSYGNAFTGHYKSMDIQVNYFQNGKEIAATRLDRRSLGGMTGMFKSSCGVLDRVTATLSKDVIKWLQRQQKTAQ